MASFLVEWIAYLGSYFLHNQWHTTKSTKSADSFLQIFAASLCLNSICKATTEQLLNTLFYVER